MTLACAPTRRTLLHESLTHAPSHSCVVTVWDKYASQEEDMQLSPALQGLYSRVEEQWLVLREQVSALLHRGSDREERDERLL